VERLVQQDRLLLGLDCGMGKSRIVITAASRLWSNDEIDAVVVVGPASARTVWADPDPILGEVAKWMPSDFPYRVNQYHAKHPLPEVPEATMQWIVTNPEFIRRPERLQPLIDWCAARRVLLVGDESWQWKSPTAKQTKAMAKLRAACTRVVLLNGTPGEPKEQYAQFAILGKDIVGSKNWFAFRARYCTMGGYMNKQITGYQRMDEYHERTAPFVTVRKIRHFLDIGEEPIRTTISVQLTPETWRIYKKMAQDFVANLKSGEIATASMAAVAAMRLAQITNGFIGGVEVEENLFDERRLQLPETTKAIGREKLDALIEWLPANWDGHKLLIFTRFRADVERTTHELQQLYPGHEVRCLYGGQKPAERAVALHLLAPGGDSRPAIVVANTQSGGAGLNFSAASLCIFMANDFSLKTRLQAEGRVDRPGQQGRARFVDVIATGPDLQRTVDYAIVRSLLSKQSVSDMTLAQWREIMEVAQ
jgi:hypothetical protein